MPRTKGAAKKTAAKPKKAVPQAPPEHYFVLADGRVLKDYKELADIMDDLADNVYLHHVNKERNDFAKWIEDIFQDKELAERLRKASGKHNVQLIIYRHILGRQ